MKILVCISNVPDTTTKIRFTDNNSAFDTNGVQWIINPWDELAFVVVRETLERYFSDRTEGRFRLHTGTIVPPPDAIHHRKA